MSALGPILGTRIAFGTTPDTIPVSLRRNTWIMVVLAPLFYVAALTQLPAPLDPFRGAFGPGIAVMSWAGTGAMVLLALAAIALLWMKRAVGVLAIMPVFTYVNMILSALMIAVIPIGSLTLLVGTVLLVAWSVAGVLGVHRKIPDTTVHALRKERLFVQEGRAHLLPGTALENGGLARDALSRLRSAPATILEFVGAFVVLLFGGVLVPVAIATDFGSTGWLALVIWFLCTSIFLASRGIVNSMLLLAKVMGQGPVRSDNSAGNAN